MEIKELQIAVPWGHIAVKTWGKEENYPILAFHGLQDNASTFDRLIPLLPQSYYYICVDLPSHGQSSHFPSFLPINTIDFVLVYKIIADHFDRKDYIIIGHSYGAQIGMLFTQVYPEYVSKLIMLDVIHFYTVSTSNFARFIRNHHAQVIETNEKLAKNNAPRYTYQEALTRLREKRRVGEITMEAAEALVKRSLIPAENGKYMFSNDQRLKAFMNPTYDRRYGATLLKKNPIKCPMLIILASDTSSVHSYFKLILKELQKNKLCVVHKVSGTHDIHNNNPEVVAPIINKFLIHQTSKL